MNVEIINPFISGATEVINQVAQIQLTTGKPYLRNLDFNNDTLRIMIGITGEIQGQVIIAIPIENAKQIASNMMMGMPVTELNEIATSAISELGNMIMGKTSTILSTKRIITDITPPILETGQSHMNMTHFQNVCVPMLTNNQIFLELNIIAKQN